MFLGVRAKSGELIVADCESKEVKYVRTVKRIPEEQRWDAKNLEWISVVPWNRGPNDKDADGDLPEFDVRKGPGRQLTEEEKQDIATSVVPKIIHRAHLRKADFDKHGYTDRCPGCSAILRGLHVQPHTPECRQRLEEVLTSDVRVRNARIRMQERTAKFNANDEEPECAAKRRKLEDIENQAMVEKDSEKLAKLFEEYREEYLKTQGADDDDERKRRRADESGRMVIQERASGSQSPPVYEEMEIGNVVDGDPRKWERSVTEDSEYAWDDVNDMELPLDLVKKARKEEMEHMKGKIFKVVKKSEAWEMTGKAPMSTKWVDTDKTHGTGEPMVRSRWVARDFRDPSDKDREDLFSATPPIEMMRYMISRQATRRKDGRERKSMYLDIKKAHVIPLCEQDVYVELPAEAEVQEDECGKLIHWLYGCRPAAQAWEEHYSALLKEHGFQRLRSVPVAFVHETRDLMGVVHGDDFVFVGLDEDLDFVLKILGSRYEIKNRGRLGRGSKDVQTIDMLGRTIKITKEGISWEGDPRHQDILVKHFGMNDSTKVLNKNGYGDVQWQGGSPEEEVELTVSEAKTYRMLAARLNYMAQDNPLLQYPAKEVCRSMARPSVTDFGKVKRLVRFLKGVGPVKFNYEMQEESEAKHIMVYVDSDWAGCQRTRRSTTGGVMKVGRHVVRTWSATQPTVATSSGEAELIAMAEGASRGLGLRTMMMELGFGPELQVVHMATDSSVAKSFVSTRGLGKMRHLDVKLLWLQECVQKGLLNVAKVRGATNVADALTKYQDVKNLRTLWQLHGVECGPTGEDCRAEGGCEQRDP